MLTSMLERRLHAAGGGRPALTTVGLQFRFLLPVNGQTALMP
jgi:hypothetical protein